MAKALKFNPSFQTDDEAVANFVVRQYEYESVIDALTFAASSGTEAPHFLVVAPRGAGKTTLCRRVVAETRRSPTLGDAWQAIFLGEESYAVTTPGEFFLECLFQLKDQVPSGRLHKDHAHATEAKSEEELIDLTLRALREFARTAGKRLLVVVENFHMILNEQIQDSKGAGAKGLIDALDDDTLFAVLATSVTQASDEDAVPLPEHYHRIELLPLSLSECRELWESLTSVEVKEERLRPLQILTGGSPRLLHILAEFMRTPSLHDLMTNLNYLIDQNTEYFKSQLDALPALERKVFATLLDMWDPSTAKQVADSARVNTNTASAMLARLTDRGAVVKEPGQGRTAIYYAAERLFNIYYLMRRRSHPSSRVRALVTFMMEYYDGDELVDTTALLMREACDIEPARRGDYHSTFDAIMLHSSEAVRDKILARTPPDFIQSFRNDQRAFREQVASYLPRDPSGAEEDASMQALIGRIEKAADEDDLATAHDLVMEGIRANSEMSELWIRLSFLELQRGNSDEANTAAERARQIRPDDPWSHAVMGLALAVAGRTEEAEASYMAAIEKDPGQSLALTSVASLLERRGEKASAAALFKVAQEAQALSDLTRSHYGKLLDRMGRKSEAEAVLREGADEFENGLSRHVLVEFLEEQARQGEGIRLLEMVAEKHDRWEVWADLGHYLLARTHDFTAARNALRNAIDMGGDRPVLYLRLARAIKENGGPEDAAAAVAVELISRRPEDPQAWVSAGLIYEELNDEVEAEAAYRAALERDNGDIALVPLARMLQKQRNRRVEAEELFRRAVASASGRRKCASSRELAELLVHNGDDAQAIDVIEAALQSNDRCACCLVLRGDVCRRRGDTAAAENDYRAALEVDSTEIAALTGLAQLVSGKEADELITQAIEADPDDPRVLLARAHLHTAHPDAQAKDAEAALELDPKFIEAHLFLTQAEASRGNLGDAIRHMEAALADLPSRRELIPSFVGVAMATAKLDNGIRVSELLEQHQNALTVEPLVVALKMARGEKPMVAKEVRDVAWDILMRSSAQQRHRQLTLR